MTSERMRDVERRIHEAMKAFEGQRFTTITIKEAITDIMERVNPGSGERVRVARLWESFSRRERVQWFLLNRFPFKSLGQQLRNAIDKWNRALARQWLDSGKSDEPPPNFPYPRILKLEPRGVVVASFTIPTPREYINVSIDFENRPPNAEGPANNRDPQPEAAQRSSGPPPG